MSSKSKYPLTGFSKISYDELLGIIDMLNTFKELGDMEKELILLAMAGMQSKYKGGLIPTPDEDKYKIKTCTNAIPTPNGAIAIEHIDRVLEFCYKNIGSHWANKIASDLLFCDYFDVKTGIERYFFMLGREVENDK